MRTENQTIGRLFYLLAALQILIISGGAILGLLVAPASLFVSQTENEAFVWIALGFIGLANVALGIILILLSIAAAIGFRNEKKWRKIVGSIAAGLAILEFPFGTILGGYLVWKIINRKKKLMKLKFYQSLFLIAALGFAFNQTAAAQAVDERQILNAADVPMEGAAIEDFAPKNWKITSRASGDLNGDRLADAVLIVAANDFDSALIVIFKRASGGFTRAAVAPNARRCDCGSVLGDGTPAIKIERGQIVFFGSSGSREAQEKRMRFRWEAAARRFLLIGDDLETIDRAVGDTQTISSNYLTNLQIITETAPHKRDRKRTRKIPAQRIYLDELDYQNYWEQFEEQRENL